MEQHRASQNLFARLLKKIFTEDKDLGDVVGRELGAQLVFRPSAGQEWPIRQVSYINEKDTVEALGCQ